MRYVVNLEFDYTPNTDNTKLKILCSKYEDFEYSFEVQNFLNKLSPKPEGLIILRVTDTIKNTVSEFRKNRPEDEKFYKSMNTETEIDWVYA